MKKTTRAMSMGMRIRRISPNLGFIESAMMIPPIHCMGVLTSIRKAIRSIV